MLLQILLQLLQVRPAQPAFLPFDQTALVPGHPRDRVGCAPFAAFPEGWRDGTYQESWNLKRKCAIFLWRLGQLACQPQ